MLSFFCIFIFMIKDILKSKYYEYLDGLDIYENKGSLILSKIVINDKFKGKGIGTKIMSELVNYADNNKQIIALTPSSDFGGDKNRLVQFYKKFGFKNNKGVHKSYEFSDTMIRYPKIKESMENTSITESKQRSLIRRLIRENVELLIMDETPDTNTFDIFYNKRKAGTITCGPAPKSLGEDTNEIVSLDLDDEYININVANQAVKSLWSVDSKINRFVIVVPKSSQLFWEKLGFQRLNDTFHMLMRGH